MGNAVLDALSGEPVLLTVAGALIILL